MDNKHANYKWYIGIDPGLSGYIVILDKSGRLAERFKTPTKLIKKKNVLDDDGILAFLRSHAVDSVCCIERQHAMSKQGLASTGKTMYGYGLLVGLLKGVGIQTEIIGAKEWQKLYLEAGSEDTKKASVDSVKKWEQGIDLRRTVKCRIDDHNMADAVCIARFAHQKFNQT